MAKKQIKEEKVSRKSLISALFMLLITAIALTTASYSWFTANTTVSIESLDVKVTSADGLQISADGTTWKASLTLDDLNTGYTGHTNQIPSSTNELAPVSTAGTIDAKGNMEMFLGGIASNVKGDQILTAEKLTDLAGTTGNYVAFDLFLKANTQTVVNLTKASDVIAATGSDDTGLKNASRVAFIVEGYAANGEITPTVTDSAATPIIWEPNSNVHTARAITHAQQNYKQTITASTVVSNYLGVKAEITEENDVAINAGAGDYLATVTPGIQTPADNATNGANKTLLTIEPGVTKVRVYCWVEGQDYDCEDYASGSKVTFNIEMAKNS